MLTSDDFTLAIAEYVHGMIYDNLPKEAIANAKLSILDTLAVMFAGSRHEVGRIIAEYVGMDGRVGPATVIGTQVQTSAELAALANGAMAHVDDYDGGGMGHANTQSLPAALALGEARGISGEQLITAYVIGREICVRLAECFHYSGGWEGVGPEFESSWHNVGIAGSMGATASAAKILRLNPQAICNAFGISASLSGGVFANRGTMTKSLHAGNAARNGVLASILASRAFTADTKIFTTHGGFSDAFGLPDKSIVAAAEKLRTRLDIIEHGNTFKRYPSCAPTHRYIETVRRMRSRYQLAPEEVDSIECTATKSLRIPYPRTDLECKFSAAFSVVATLIDGEVSLHNCTESFLKREDVQALLTKTVYVDAPAGHGTFGGFVRVKTRNGEVYQEAITREKGDLTTHSEVQSKFYDCAVPVVGADQARRIESVVDKLEEVRSVSLLTALLRPKNLSPDSGVRT
jgi:2-methylcitrate dehydratase PrpD